MARLRRRADGGFAAAINQAPMRRRTRGWALLWVDYALNAFSALCRVGRLPPEHLLRQVVETRADFDQAREALESAPLARPAIFVLVGTQPGQLLVIERDCTSAHSYADITVVANVWRDMSGNYWRGRTCGEGTPVENNRRRMAALAQWSGRDADGCGWATVPVVNACTRLTVEMHSARGTLAVAGWEPDGFGSAAPVTAVTIV